MSSTFADEYMIAIRQGMNGYGTHDKTREALSGLKNFNFATTVHSFTILHHCYHYHPGLGLPKSIVAPRFREWLEALAQPMGPRTT